MILKYIKEKKNSKKLKIVLSILALILISYKAVEIYYAHKDGIYEYKKYYKSYKIYEPSIEEKEFIVYMGEQGLSCEISYSPDSEFETPTYSMLEELNYLVCEPSHYTETIGGDSDKLTIGEYSYEVRYSFILIQEYTGESFYYILSPYLTIDIYDKENLDISIISYMNSFPDYNQEYKLLDKGKITLYIGDNICKYEFQKGQSEQLLEEILLNKKEIEEDDTLIFLDMKKSG